MRHQLDRLPQRFIARALRAMCRPKRLLARTASRGLRADELLLGIPEMDYCRAIGEANHAIAVQRQDHIGSARNHRVIARVLPVAQIALAPDGHA